MKKPKKRKGSAYILVIVALIFVSVISVLLVTKLNQSIYQTNTYSLQMKAFYLNNQAEKATVAVLLQDNNDLLRNMSYPQTDSMDHTDTDGNYVGRSEIVLTKQQLLYYGENKDWIVADITTEIEDPRAGNDTHKFAYEGTVLILLENPLIQLYNINPESLF